MLNSVPRRTKCLQNKNRVIHREEFLCVYVDILVFPHVLFGVGFMRDN